MKNDGSCQKLLFMLGMTIEEARKVMENFRQGKLNILVSTSVLSEGINIPDCRGLIRYMFIKDVVAQVQESGQIIEYLIQRC